MSDVPEITGDEVRKVAEDLDWHNRNVNIAKVVGASASIVGVVAGTGAGAIMAAAGGATSAGATIAMDLIEQKKVGDVEKTLPPHSNTCCAPEANTAPKVAKVVAEAAAPKVVENFLGKTAGTCTEMGFSVADLVDAGVALHQGKGSEAGDYLRKLAEDLDNEKTGP